MKAVFALVALGYKAARRVKVWGWGSEWVRGQDQKENRDEKQRKRILRNGKRDRGVRNSLRKEGEGITLAVASAIEGPSWGILDAIWEAWDVG